MELNCLILMVEICRTTFSLLRFDLDGKFMDGLTCTDKEQIFRNLSADCPPVGRGIKFLLPERNM